MRIPFVLACLLFAGLNSAYAQIELDEVSVTGKIAERKSMLNNNSAGSYLTDSIIRANAHLTLTQLLSQQTGVVINGATQTPGSVQTVYFRGASRGLVLILLNGIPVSDGSDIDQVFDLNNISLSQVERIEILRGGQSVVYGSDAVGGVINIITRDSPNKPIEVTANAAYGSFNDIRAGVNFSGKSSGFTYQAGYNKQSAEGISATTNRSPNTTRPTEKDGFNRDALNFDLRKTLGKNTSLYSNLRYATYQADFDAAAFTEDHDNTAKSKNLQFGIGANYNFSKGLLNLSYNRLNTERIYEDDSTDVPESAFNKYSYATYQSVNDFFEIYTTLTPFDNFNLLIGADFQRISTDQTFRSVSNFGEFISPPITDDLANLSNISSYFTTNYIYKMIGIELGGRLNRNSNYGTNFSYSINPYFQKGDLKIYGVIAKSYKNPSLYQVFSEYGNADLNPQEAVTFDFGIEYEVRNSMKIAAVLFNRTTENLFFFNSIDVAPFGKYINLDAQSENGIELEVNKQWAKVQLFGNYTKILSTNTLVGPLREKSENLGFLRRPRNVFNTGLTYSPITKLTFNSTIQYQSKRQDRFFNNETFSSELVDLKPFTLLNLQASYNFTKNIRTSFAVNNLLNQQYFEIYGYNSLPRNFSINALVRF